MKVREQIAAQLAQALRDTIVELNISDGDLADVCGFSAAQAKFVRQNLGADDLNFNTMLYVADMLLDGATVTVSFG